MSFCSIYQILHFCTKIFTPDNYKANFDKVKRILQNSLKKTLQPLLPDKSDSSDLSDRCVHHALNRADVRRFAPKIAREAPPQAVSYKIAVKSVIRWRMTALQLMHDAGMWINPPPGWSKLKTTFLSASKWNLPQQRRDLLENPSWNRSTVNALSGICSKSSATSATTISEFSSVGSIIIPSN